MVRDHIISPLEKLTLLTTKNSSQTLYQNYIKTSRFENSFLLPILEAHKKVLINPRVYQIPPTRCPTEQSFRKKEKTQ